MYVVCVTVKVKAEFVQQFIEAIRKNHEGTRSEPGNLRFDVLQGEDDPTRFFLYEVYRSKEDFPAHQQTAHFLEWRQAVTDMMAEPRVGLRYTSLFPSDDSANW
ncbi:MAG: antibiotic biosynthesis monooxygenase [Anaerolineae bacterium]|nr:antibiotic biosynthesis monooxygenase [Anaerolineae bacterium]